MKKLWPAEIAVKALQAEGVDTMFGLLGGHIQSIQDHAYRAGMKVLQVRHEQAGVHAADGFARVTGRPGVCYGTAGPGMLNMVNGIHMAYVSRTPIVCLFGGHKEVESHRGSVQEAYAAEVCRSITKWTVRVTEPEMTAHFIRKAFRDAMTPPYGPVGIEFPIDKFSRERLNESDQVAYRQGSWRAGAAASATVDPAFAARAMQALLQAKRPLLLGGEGVHWAGAGSVLKALVERVRIPFNLRRLGRGAIREDHPLAISGGARKEMIEGADLVLVVGLQVGYFEGFGEWKTDARFIQLQNCADDVLQTLPTEIEMVGDLKAVLQQMLDSVPHIEADRDRGAWLERATQLQKRFLDRLAADADSVSSDAPIHPRWLSKIVNEFVTPDFNIVFDSFTSSTYLGEQLLATRSGQVLDAGLNAAFGHGVGMGIGAQMGRPDSPVLVMMGDGGIGLGGGDVETAMRYGLPVVYLIYNDSAYCAGLEQYCYGEDFKMLGEYGRKGYRLTQDVRYDQMYAPLGCHTELVERPEDVRGALERAFASGKTSVINLIGTRHVRHPLYESSNAREMFWTLPASEVQEPARKRHHEYFYPKYHGGAKLED